MILQILNITSKKKRTYMPDFIIDNVDALIPSQRPTLTSFPVGILLAAILILLLLMHTLPVNQEL